jgi:hypothetical protein
MSTELSQLVPTLKVKELSPGTILKLELPTYEVEINTQYEYPKIKVEYSFDGRWASIEFFGPDPEASVAEIVKEAQALIEKFMRKKASAP